MSNNEWELGYSRDIALERLMVLYGFSDSFNHDQHYIDTRPELSQYREDQIFNGRGLEPYFKGLHKHRDNYSRFTNEWRDDWEAALKIIPDDLRLEDAKIAEKWGLRCDCGCGFIISFSPDFRGFILSPGPPDRTVELKTKVDIYDDKKSIKQNIENLETEASKFIENTRNNLGALDYRGFEKQKKKDISTQVQWLFWHITPPYLSSAEIETILGTSDRFYIQRCYQKMAKLLGIKLTRGWTKGRRRATQDTRAVMRINEIEAKIALKNDL
jgi:hypothetical protein